MAGGGVNGRPVDSAGPDVMRALDLLAECLRDEDPWEPEDLVERMEAVYDALGGDLNAIA